MNYSELEKMTVSELRSLNEVVVNMITMKRRMEASIKKVALKVGMVVKVNHPKLMGRELVINKINRTKATLGIIGGVGSYSVPITMIEY